MSTHLLLPVALLLAGICPLVTAQPQSFSDPAKLEARQAGTVGDQLPQRDGGSGGSSGPLGPASQRMLQPLGQFQNA